MGDQQATHYTLNISKYIKNILKDLNTYEITCFSVFFTHLTVLNLVFVAFVRNAILSHASRLALATDSLHQEMNSCLQLCLHPSPALNGDAI